MNNTVHMNVGGGGGEGKKMRGESVNNTVHVNREEVGAGAEGGGRKENERLNNNMHVKEVE